MTTYFFIFLWLKESTVFSWMAMHLNVQYCCWLIQVQISISKFDYLNPANGVINMHSDFFHPLSFCYFVSTEGSECTQLLHITRSDNNYARISLKRYKGKLALHCCVEEHHQEGISFNSDEVFINVKLVSPLAVMDLMCSHTNARTHAAPQIKNSHLSTAIAGY